MRSFDNLAFRLENNCNLVEVNNGVSLLRALISDVVPNIGGIKGSLRRSWKHFGPLKIVHLHSNVFSIVVTPVNVDELLLGGPWHVDNKRFIVVRWKPNLTVRDVHLHKAWYWVQISGLTWEKLNNNNAKEIGAEIGEVLQLEDISQEDITLRAYLRIKVLLNVRDAFPTGFWLPLNSFTKTRVEFAYEGLKDFCYCCGRLGHKEDECQNPLLINHESYWGRGGRDLMVWTMDEKECVFSPCSLLAE
ncbi:uncharacterized protein LOC126802568 [Argentina anserina]|uniref:uncharacterized protein LOC126802568 n=1 Tax=Argentina anserina TaxID=57926 RepID=UPI0021764F78|nr:uncharacterized protein LOC126802568 [Potentilla anserina]